MLLAALGGNWIADSGFPLRQMPAASPSVKGADLVTPSWNEMAFMGGLILMAYGN